MAARFWLADLTIWEKAENKIVRSKPNRNRATGLKIATVGTSKS
jgi:hypothetical protein